MAEQLRQFPSGANRNSNVGKHDIEAFINPLCDDSFHAYMHKHQQLEDGTTREGDNWQKGIPPVELMKSLTRHFHELRMIERGYGDSDVVEVLNAIRFNVEALKLHYLNEQQKKWPVEIENQLIHTDEEFIDSNSGILD